MERRYAVLDVIDAIRYQTMQVDVEIGHRTKTLNQRDRTALCITSLESGLFDQKSGNGTLFCWALAKYLAVVYFYSTG
ncbi:hypothetical protein R2Q26_14770 [Nitrosomonas sp. Is37]|nr:hypothetical protein [Nitrosomonas sp. Is37]MDV6345791.1 hypothetical protein [Nitrosomonas sp. Is37]